MFSKLVDGLTTYNPSDWTLTKRLLGYMKPFMGIFIGIVLTAFGRHGIFALIAPLIIALIIDYVLVPIPGETHWFIEMIKKWTKISDQTGLLLILCGVGNIKPKHSTSYETRFLSRPTQQIIHISR